MPLYFPVPVSGCALLNNLTPGTFYLKNKVSSFTVTWFSFFTLVWVDIFLEIVSSNDATTHIFQSGLRIKSARVNRRKIEVFNQQAWD